MREFEFGDEVVRRAAELLRERNGLVEAVDYEYDDVEALVEMLDGFGDEVPEWLETEARERRELQRRLEREVSGAASSSSTQETVVNEGPDVGRNDPCPCGSGRKYKHCCG